MASILSEIQCKLQMKIFNHTPKQTFAKQLITLTQFNKKYVFHIILLIKKVTDGVETICYIIYLSVFKDFFALLFAVFLSLNTEGVLLTHK